MGRHSISLVVFCLIFGFLLGLAGFLSMAYLGGFVETKEAEAQGATKIYLTATEKLEEYRCRSVEEKVILMGGLEDGFDPKGDEPAKLSQSLKIYLEDLSEYTAQVPGERTKGYDDPSQNSYFVDVFDIPSRTFHGIIALRIEDLSGVKNDGVRIGYMENHAITEDDAIHMARVAEIENNWPQGVSYQWANLDDLKVYTFENRETGSAMPVGLSHRSVLDVIRENDDNLFQVEISDDTIVDFVGFALCLEPAEHKGSVFSRFHHNGPKGTYSFGNGFVSLYGNSPTAAGNLACTERRPVACIHDKNLKAPAAFTNQTNPIWSGGNLKFTEPVQGNKFKSEDDVDAYCVSEFGAEFRSVNVKDGAWMGALVGYGEYPEGYDDFWAGYKDSPHHNCWSLRMDYDDLTRLEAKK